MWCQVQRSRVRGSWRLHQRLNMQQVGTFGGRQSSTTRKLWSPTSASTASPSPIATSPTQRLSTVVQSLGEPGAMALMVEKQSLAFETRLKHKPLENLTHIIHVLG